MWRLLRAGLVVLCLVLVVCQGVGAFHVSAFTVDPKGSLVPGTSVNVTFTINNPSSDSDGFPKATDIEMFSELARVSWTLVVFSDEDITTSFRKQRSGLILSEDGIADIILNTQNHEQVIVTLSGTAPVVDMTMNKTLIRITQLDSAGTPIEGSNRTINTIIINTCCINSPILALKSDLGTFRAHIDEKTAIGVNTTLAEEKYSLAEQKITSARSRPSTQYSTALSEYNEGRTAITEGERLLDKAWAEKEIADAQEPIKKSDEIFHELMIRGARQEDTPELQLAIHQRELAMLNCSDAYELIDSGQYSKARERGAAAQTLGNESYTLALNVQKTWSRPLFRAALSPLCGVVAIGIVGLLVVLYRKRGELQE